MVKILPLGALRIAVAQAMHHAHHRVAFGKHLIEQPPMKNVLGGNCYVEESVMPRLNREIPLTAFGKVPAT
jgi:hypothetical protein